MIARMRWIPAVIAALMAPLALAQVTVIPTSPTTTTPVTISIDTPVCGDAGTPIITTGMIEVPFTPGLVCISPWPPVTVNVGLLPAGNYTVSLTDATAPTAPPLVTGTFAVTANLSIPTLDGRSLAALAVLLAMAAVLALRAS